MYIRHLNKRAVQAEGPYLTHPVADIMVRMGNFSFEKQAKIIFNFVFSSQKDCFCVKRTKSVGNIDE